LILEPSFLLSDIRSFYAIACSHFLDSFREIIAHSALRKEKHCRDLSHAGSISGGAQNRLLTRCQRVTACAQRCQCLRRVNNMLSTYNLTYGCYQLSGWSILKQKSGDPVLYCLSY